jgi:phosphohistidine phosphatase
MNPDEPTLDEPTVDEPTAAAEPTLDEPTAAAEPEPDREATAEDADATAEEATAEEATAEEVDATPTAPEPAEAPSRPLQLYLLRHADAGDPATWRGDDSDRPLSGKGRRQARWMGRWLATQRKLPDVIVTSPKVRAAQTAVLATEGSDLKLIVDERLASGAGLEDVVAIIQEHAPKARRVMLVGHDPDFSEMASELTGASIAIKKGAVARIDVSGPVRPGAGTLRWLVPAEAVAEG